MYILALYKIIYTYIYRKDLYTSNLVMNMCLTVILCGVHVAYAWLEWRPDNARRFNVVQAS